MNRRVIIAAVELTKASAEPRRAIDLGHPRGRRGAGEPAEGVPHSPLCPPLYLFYMFYIAGVITVSLIKSPTTLCSIEINELLRGYIHAP